MIKELDPTSSVGDLVDYLLEYGVDIHILVSDNSEKVLEIKGDYTPSGGKQLKCAKCIDLYQYKHSPPELRSMIMTQTIYSMVEELIYL